MDTLITIFLKAKQQAKKSQDNCISWPIGSLLNNYVTQLKPTSILELGTSIGFSTLWLAKGTTCPITTVDINKERQQEAQQTFISCGLKRRITCINQEILTYIDTCSSTFDVIFIDALQKDYQQLLKVLLGKNIATQKTTIIFDNVSSHNMQAFIEYCTEAYSHCTHIDLHSGLLIVKP